MIITKAELNGFIIACEFIKATGGDTSLWTDLKVFAENHGIQDHDFVLAINFLTRKNLISPYGAGYTYFISEHGVDEVTRAIKFPNIPTDSFAPVVDIQAALKINGKNILL